MRPTVFFARMPTIKFHYMSICMVARQILFCILSLMLLILGGTKIHADEIDVLVIRGKQDLTNPDWLNNSRDDFKIITTEAADMLVGLPGLQVDSRSNFAQDTRVSIRGFGARSAFGIRGIDLIVDGIPINTPDGQGQLSSIQPDSLESLQLITGPLSVLYGNSPGGVIVMNTRVPEKTEFSLQHSASSQDQFYSQLNANIRENNLAIATQINYLQTDTDRPHSQSERRQESVAIYYTSENQIDWIVKYDQSHDPLLEDPLGLTPQQFDENPFQENSAAIDFNTRKSVDNQQISVMLRKTESSTRWQLGMWHTERAIEQFLGFSGEALSSAGGVVDLQREVWGINANLTQDFDLFNKPWQWTLGTEMTAMQDDRLGFVNQSGIKGDLRRNETDEINNRDLFTLIQFWPFASTRFYLGNRYTKMDFAVDDYVVIDNVNPDDTGEKTFSESATALGLEYNFADSWSLFTNVSQGFETPTLTEMAYKTNEPGLNTDLIVSEQEQNEWGVNFSTNNWQWRLTQFYIKSDNEIMVDQSVNGRTSYRNELKTRRQGYELFHRQRLNSYWQTQLSVQYLEAEFTDGQWQNNQLPGVAKYLYQAGIGYQPFANSQLDIHLDTQYRDKVASADNNQVFASSWQVWNLAIRGKLMQSHLQWWIAVNNLADKMYVGSVIVNQTNGRAFEPALGRHFWLGSRFSF